MGERRIAQELKIQMKEQGLKFTITDPLELEEVIAETAEYIFDSYARSGDDINKVRDYLKETMENYPEHIEPIREYIQPNAIKRERNLLLAAG